MACPSSLVRSELVHRLRWSSMLLFTFWYHDHDRFMGPDYHARSSHLPSLLSCAIDGLHPLIFSKLLSPHPHQTLPLPAINRCATHHWLSEVHTSDRRIMMLLRYFTPYMTVVTAMPSSKGPRGTVENAIIDPNHSITSSNACQKEDTLQQDQSNGRRT